MLRRNENTRKFSNHTKQLHTHNTKILKLWISENHRGENKKFNITPKQYRI